MSDNIVMLVDADVLAYEAAFIAQEPIQWEEDMWTLHGDMGIARDCVHRRLDAFREKLGATDMMLALSDPRNFRRKLNPLYKAGRRKTLKPILLREVRKWIAGEFPTSCWRNLEADDVLSILATERPNRKDTRIIVSIDKDFRGVPGRFYDFNRDEYHKPTVREADEFHLVQTIAGDYGDGYTGVPSIGMKRGRDYLKKHGYVWEAVVKLFEKHGLDEGEALMNAWMARLLRKPDYNLKRKELRYLWTPANYDEKDKRRHSKVIHQVTGDLSETENLLPFGPFEPISA